MLLDNFSLVLATVSAVILGKGVIAFGVVLVLGYPLKMALAVAVALAQIGEFSFILAGLGRELGILPPLATHILVATAIITITLNPLLFRAVPKIAAHLGAIPFFAARGVMKQSASDDVPSGDSTPSEHRAVIVGYGPVGRMVHRILRANEIECGVIELNLDTVKELTADGTKVIYGDVTRPEVLKSAGVESAGTLILAASSIPGREEIVRVAKRLNPDLQIIARTSYVSELVALRALGTEKVFSGEGEVAMAIAEELLSSLGASPQQIDKERARLRAELRTSTSGE